MADVNRGNRPLSPHVSVWRWETNAIMSILHRITGVSMMLAAAMIVWWFLAASTSQAYFEIVDGIVTSWLGGLVLLLSCFALWYHFCNGIRHIVWDLGYGFGLDEVQRSSYAVMAGAAVLSLITLFFVW